MASTVALMIAAISSSQTNPDEIKKPVAVLDIKKVPGRWQPLVRQVLPDSIVPNRLPTRGLKQTMGNCEAAQRGIRVRVLFHFPRLFSQDGCFNP